MSCRCRLRRVSPSHQARTANSLRVLGIGSAPASGPRARPRQSSPRSTRPRRQVGALVPRSLFPADVRRNGFPCWEPLPGIGGEAARYSAVTMLWTRSSENNRTSLPVPVGSGTALTRCPASGKRRGTERICQPVICLTIRAGMARRASKYCETHNISPAKSDVHHLTYPHRT